MSKNRNLGGRPEFKPSADLRRMVAVAAGGGMSHEEIAISLGIARGTLEKHFSLELSEGAYKKRFEVLQALHRAAKKGNVAAIREYTKMTPRISVPPAAPEAARTPTKGKKEQAQDDAVTAAAGTEWESLLNRPPLQ